MMLTVDLFSSDSSFNLLKGQLPKKVDGISNTRNPKANTFCFIKSKQYLIEFNRDNLSNKNVGILFEEKFFNQYQSFVESHPVYEQAGWCAQVKDVGHAMCLFSKPFYDHYFSELNYFVDGRQMGTAEVDSTAQIAQGVFIGDKVKIAADVVIYPGVTIMPNSRISEGTILFPNVTIYPYVSIGKNCRIHAQTSIGADGFGYNFVGGAHKKIWHFSGVVIGDDVEIGASSSVDSGAFEPTFIGSGTKIDNGVQVGHNAWLGKHCMVCGQVAIAGSSVLEDYVVLGGRVGISPNATLGKGSQLAANSIVSENARWPAGSVLGGSPAMPLKDWMKYQAKLRLLTKK